MTKEHFMERIEHCFIQKDEYMRNIQKLFDKGVITDKDIEEMDDNFIPIYPIAAAIYKSETEWYLTGSCDDSVTASAKRKCNYYKSML